MRETFSEKHGTSVMSSISTMDSVRERRQSPVAPRHTSLLALPTAAISSESKRHRTFLSRH